MLLFCEVLFGNLGFELFFEVHLLEAPVLVFELLHATHHRRVHTTELGALFVKGRCADAHFSADLRHCQTDLNTL